HHTAHPVRFLFFYMLRPPPRFTLFPYTTLFRSLSFFGFTATPKPKTLEVFGVKGIDGKPRPFHLYSMRQAIEEGFILDVLAHYTDRKSTRLNSSHLGISYAVFCLKKKNKSIKVF